LQVIKRKRSSAPSIKVGCNAYFNKKVYTNGDIEVIYHWKHKNHDPFEAESFVNESRLPAEVRRWIVEAVEVYKDWKTIKTVLRLNEQELEHVSQYITY
jgi:hypothetical protein